MRKIKGFTLVELLVVVVIIGILAAIALPNFIGAQKKAKAAAVKGNMRTVQIAAESYATDSGGSYPADFAGAAKNYLPGGDSKLVGGTAGTIPLNPVTGKAGAIADASLKTSAAITAARAAAPGASPAGQGGLAFSQADTGNSYAIRGGDADGNDLGAAGGTTLILSNQ